MVKFDIFHRGQGFGEKGLRCFESLFLHHPDYSSLRVFGCLCFPNITATTKHKLEPRSLPCVYLGPSDDHKGSRCYDPSSGRVLISRHVTFDENVFPYATISSLTSTTPPSITNPTQRPLLYQPIAHPPSPPTEPTDTSPHDPCPTPVTPPTPAVAEFSARADSTLPPTPATTEISSVSPAAATYDPDLSSGSSPVALSDAPIPPNAVSVEIPHNDHVMRTRGKRGFHLPVRRLNLSATTTISPIPTTYKRALLDPL